MQTIIDVERQIAELEKELGDALYPVTREEFVRDVQRTADTLTNLPEFLREERRNHPEQAWLSFLKEIKRQKDADSTIWRKMQRWD